jgi:hypothetical protein
MLGLRYGFFAGKFSFRQFLNCQISCPRIVPDAARVFTKFICPRRVVSFIGTLSGTDALMRTNRRPKLFHFIWDDGHSRTFVAVRALEPEETFAVEVDEDAEASCWSAHLTIASPRTATAKGRRPRWPPMPAHISFPRWTTSTPQLRPAPAFGFRLPTFGAHRTG